MSPPKYSIVVPVYRSAATLPELHRRLTEVLCALGEPYEIVFVDDCSPDGAWSVLRGLAERDRAVVALQLMHNAGQGNATLCGLSEARGEIVVTLDDDLQHPPEEIPSLLRALGEDIDVVMGVPWQKRHHWFRRLGSVTIHLVNSWILGKDPGLRFTSFRAIRRQAVDSVLQLKTLSPALGPMINSVTRRIVNVRVEHRSRKEGRSGYTFSRLFVQTLDSLVGYSMLPLRLLALVGGIGILCSLTYSCVLLVRYLLGGIHVPGWTSIILLLILSSGFNFFAFAIIGEYVLRILKRVNATPQYFLRQRVCGLDDAHPTSGQQGGAGAPRSTST
jgi:polyisoprenyl-phosphate glycosyltransferase